MSNSKSQAGNEVQQSSEADVTTSAPITPNPMLVAGVCEPSEIVEKAAKLLQPIKYEPNYIGCFVKLNDRDMGNEDYCKNCITDAVKEARKFHKEQRQKILDKFKQISETGFWNGINIKEKYTEKEISKAKRYELKKYPAKAIFTYEGHDPDFGGGETYPKTCEGCGEYFDTNFEPSIEIANWLLEDFGDGTNLSESFKWKLDIAFSNFNCLEEEVQKKLLSMAEKIVSVS
jgi:hypothetical protein